MSKGKLMINSVPAQSPVLYKIEGLADKSFTQSINQSIEQRRVLVFRSAPSWLFDKAIDSLKAAGPLVIDVYCPKTISSQLASRNDLGMIIDDNWDGFYRSKCITKALVSKLRARRYDQIIILYNDAFGEAYGPLRKLAFKIGASQVSSLNINLLWSGLKGEGIIGRYLLPRKWFYNLMLVVFTIEIIATTLWDRMAFTMRRLVGLKPPMPKPHAR
jgi:hypothetical protein